MSNIIDFHTHILPGMDDGSKSVEESIAMLRQETEQGIDNVVLTSHFYARYSSPSKFLMTRNEAEALLRREMSKHNDLPNLYTGAEIYFFSGISDSDALWELTIDKKGCIILEMPESPWTDSMFKEIENISIKQGITPIIAHIDRYIRPFRTYGILERLSDMPVLVQANASFFLNKYTKRMALRLLQTDKIHLLGSDCHNITSRPPNLGQALGVIEQRLGTEALDRIVNYQEMLFSAE